MHRLGLCRGLAGRFEVCKAPLAAASTPLPWTDKATRCVWRVFRTAAAMAEETCSQKGRSRGFIGNALSPLRRADATAVSVEEKRCSNPNAALSRATVLLLRRVRLHQYCFRSRRCLALLKGNLKAACHSFPAHRRVWALFRRLRGFSPILKTITSRQPAGLHAVSSGGGLNETLQWVSECKQPYWRRLPEQAATCLCRLVSADASTLSAATSFQISGW
jgi:hypothetical protein